MDPIAQPLDKLMTQLGLANADLVNASTEQLTFKMVAKGRKGKRLTPNVQDKILKALLTAKPDLDLRRRDLFRYEPADEAGIGAYEVNTRKRTIKYMGESQKSAIRNIWRVKKKSRNKHRAN